MITAMFLIIASSFVLQQITQEVTKELSEKIVYMFGRGLKRNNDRP
jgi:hypothetical protein